MIRCGSSLATGCGSRVSSARMTTRASADSASWASPRSLVLTTSPTRSRRRSRHWPGRRRPWAPPSVPRARSSTHVSRQWVAHRRTRWAGHELAEADHDDARDMPAPVTVVWGPTGAPGRTTVAVTMAAHLAATGIEHDARRPRHLGRQCGAGARPRRRGSRSGRRGASLGAGHPRRPSAGQAGAGGGRPASGCSPGCPGRIAGRSSGSPPSRTSCRLSRGVVDHVVVDVGFAVEDDEELSYDTAAPRRNASTLTALEAADHLVVVGCGGPGGAAATRARRPGRRRAAVAAADRRRQQGAFLGGRAASGACDPGGARPLRGDGRRPVLALGPGRLRRGRPRRDDPCSRSLRSHR